MTGRGPITRYEIRDATGVLVAVHCRSDKADGTKQLWWEQPNGTKGLGGHSPADLVYIAGRHERLGALGAGRALDGRLRGELPPDGAAVVVTEGEKAADAAAETGAYAVGTVCGASSTPGPAVVALLARWAPTLSPDNDPGGREHMGRLAGALERAGLPTLRWIDPPADAPKGWDLADVDLDERWSLVAGARELLDFGLPEPLEGADSWERPAGLDLEDSPPPFPTDALPSWLRAFVEAVADATQTPPDLAGMLALATVATVAAGPILVAPAPDWREGLNIFVAVAMEPGSRKSAVFKEVTRPVSALEQRLAEEMGPEIARAETRRRLAEKRLAHLEGQAAKAASVDRYQLEADSEEAAVELKRLTVPPEPRLFTSDVTSEALGSLLSDHGGRFAVLSPEGGVFDQMAGLYNKGLPNPDVFLKGHAGDTLRVDRRGRPSEYVERPALTLCLAVQPNSLIAVHGNPSLSGRGLLERFLFSMPPSMVGGRTIDPPAVPAEVRARYESSIETIARSRDALTEPVVLSLAPEAARLFRAFRSELEGRRRPSGDLTYLATWASKLDGATARLAGLLHVAQSFADGFGRPIDAVTMDAAIRLARYLIPHARVAFDLMGADVHRDDAREVLSWLRREGRRSFTRREALRELQGRFPKVATLKPALELLADHGWIRDVERSAHPGRPSIAYEITPYLHDTKTKLTQPAKSPETGRIVSSVLLSLEAPFKPSSSVSDGTDGGAGADGAAGDLTAAYVQAALDAGQLEGFALTLGPDEMVKDAAKLARADLAKLGRPGPLGESARTHLEQLAAALRASETAP